MQISFKGWNRICPLFIYAVGTNMLAWSTGPSVTVATASPVLGWRRKSVIWTVKERRALSVGAWPVCLSTKWRKFFPARGDVSMRLHFPIVIFWWSLLHHSDMFWDFFFPLRNICILFTYAYGAIDYTLECALNPNDTSVHQHRETFAYSESGYAPIRKLIFWALLIDC